MAVDQERTLGSIATFVPFHQKLRGGESWRAPVGTVEFDATATGAAGGGTVALTVRDRIDTWGFRQLYVPLLFLVRDNLAAVESVLIIWEALGNRRLRAQNHDVVTTVRSSGINVARFPISGILIEPDQPIIADIVSVIWETNTDTIIYHLHGLMAVYDLEIIERYGSVEALMETLR